MWRAGCLFVCLFCFWRDSPKGARAYSFTRFPDHTQQRTTVRRTFLDERSARRRDLYLTTHYTHNRQTSMPPVGFELTISASERPQTYALDRATTGIGDVNFGGPNFKFWPEGILRLVTKNNIPVLCTIFVLPLPSPTFPVLLHYRRYKLTPMNKLMTQYVLFLRAVRHSVGRKFITEGPLIFVLLTFYTTDQTVSNEAMFLTQGCRVAGIRYTDRLPLCYGLGILIVPIPVAARSKERVCSRSLAGIAGLNPTGSVEFCLLWVLCVVR